jgi:membrane associated rhomboid family serine protease
MQFQVPDPAFTSSEHARHNFRLALKLSLGFVAVIWCVHILGWGLNLDLAYFGVRPRELFGLPGILFAPLLHGSFSHLISNTLPMLVLGVGMLYLYPNSSVIVLPAVYLGPGILVWLFGRAAIHVGASGLVYGLVAYIFFAGVIRRDKRAVAASMLVFFLYGSLAWGVLPIEPGVSWETHLAAALIGVALAFALRDRDMPPRRRYTWEEEESEDARSGD